MAGYTYLVSGDPSMARNTVYTALESQGFKLTQTDDWSAIAERGSAGASIWLGALAGKQGRHVILKVTCGTSPEGVVITLIQETSGASGGIIGVSQAADIYADIYNAVGLAFDGAHVLISSSKL